MRSKANWCSPNFPALAGHAAHVDLPPCGPWAQRRWGRCGHGVEVQVLRRMCCLRCTLDSQMELSVGREMYESGDTMQTQKVIFIVLIQCGNANHTEKSQFITAGAIYFTRSICVSVEPVYCLTPMSTIRTPPVPLRPSGSPSNRLRLPTPSRHRLFSHLALAKAVTSLFFPLLISCPLSQI